VRDLPSDREAVVPGLPTPPGRMLGLGAPRGGRLRHHRQAAVRQLHPAAAWADCPACSDPDHPSPGQCARCLISARLDELTGPDDGSLPPGLQALRREIAAAEHTITATRWLAKPSTAPVLSGLAGGSIPLTHQALDELPEQPALAHLRHLVAADALPPRDEEMIRLEKFLHGLLDARADPERRRLLHLAPCYLPAAARWTGPAAVLDGEDRWDIARRLLHDDALKPEDRLAGLLVLLYARGITAISRMTAGQAQAAGDGTVRLQLGRVTVQLPEPVASTALAVAAKRKGHATIGATRPSPWLFPGGQPGRARLTQRLSGLGISPRQARSTALFQLAAEVPARTLGVTTSVAFTWQRLSSGDWGAYAADVSCRSPHHHEPGNDTGL
jgi:hypothetical protein